MTFFILTLGMAAFGLICLIRPQLFLKRKYEEKEIPKQDLRFFRIMGIAFIGLFLLGFIIR